MEYVATYHGYDKQINVTINKFFAPMTPLESVYVIKTIIDDMAEK